MVFLAYYSDKEEEDLCCSMNKMYTQPLKKYKLKELVYKSIVISR